MFESVKEVEGRGRRRRSAWISTAAFTHGGVLCAILAASLLARVEAGADPPEPIPTWAPRVDVKLGDFPDAGPGRRAEPAKRLESDAPEPPAKAQVQPVAPAEDAPVVPPDAPPAAPERDAARIGEDSRGGQGDRDGDGTGLGPPGTAGQPDGRIDGKDLVGRPSPPGSGPSEPSDPTAYGVEPPLLLTRVEPEYPKIDVLARLEGTVLLEVLVGASGRVESVRVMAATNPRMQDAAVRAVQRWRYRPARQNGRAIGVFITIEVHFTLQ